MFASSYDNFEEIMSSVQEFADGMEGLVVIGADRKEHLVGEEAFGKSSKSLDRHAQVCLYFGMLISCLIQK